MQVINKPYKPDLLQKPRYLVRIISAVLLVVGTILHSVSAVERKPELKVAVASNFLFPMKSLRADFENVSDVKIKITAGSTAKLYAQIINGAPFDVFLSADNTTPQRLVEENLVRPDNVFQYAQGQLVLWAVNSKIKSPDVLRQRFLEGDFFRLALANPKTAPYGRAAMDLIAHYAVNTNQAKLILGESVGQAYQFTGSGNVDMGFVALSQLKSNNKRFQGRQLTYWLPPTGAYRPILQYGAVLNKKQKNTSAEEFVRYLNSPKTQTLLREKFGYL